MAEENIPPDAPTMSEEEFQSNFESAGQAPTPPAPFAPPAPVSREQEAPKPPIRTLASDLDGTKNAGSIPPAAIDTGEPVFQPGTVSQMERVSEASVAGHRKLPLILGVIIGVGAIGAAAYFLIFPRIFPPLAEPAPIATETPTSPTPPPPPPVKTHLSAFAVPPNSTIEANLQSDEPAAIASVMELESSRTLAPGLVKEVVLKTAAGPASWKNILARLSIAGTDLNQVFWNGAYFEEDFTAFIFYDTNGAWPGYIGKINTATSGDQVLSAAKAAEIGMAMNNLYPPIATLTFQNFKDGQVNNIPTRYSVGSTKGASFNYGVFGNHFVISSSYDGLKAALPLLGIGGNL